jgi:hypothetical protein
LLSTSFELGAGWAVRSAPPIETVEIGGEVIDAANGRPIAGARFGAAWTPETMNLLGEEIAKEGVTGLSSSPETPWVTAADGRFRLTGFQPGFHLLRVEASGYVAQGVSLGGWTGSPLRIEMTPSPARAHAAR